MSASLRSLPSRRCSGASPRSCNQHSNSNLPLVLAGHAGGLRGGRHVSAEAKTPVTNLFVNLLDSVGVATESFGDSTGKLDLTI